MISILHVCAPSSSFAWPSSFCHPWGCQNDHGLIFNVSLPSMVGIHSGTRQSKGWTAAEEDETLWFSPTFRLQPRLLSSWQPQPTSNSLRPAFWIPTMYWTVAFQRNAALITDSDQGLINLIYHKKMIKPFYHASFLQTSTSSGHPNLNSVMTLFYRLYYSSFCNFSCGCVSWSLFH